MKTNTKIISSIFIFSLLMTVPVYSQVRLPKLISDGMVLQRDAEVKIWGWASANEKISINFIDTTRNTTANDKGDWSITLQKLQTGGPYEMRISANNEIIINDIMIGDVWVCSGQSNMELPMRRVSWIYEDVIKNSENKFIRHFAVSQKYNFKEPQNDLQTGNWERTNPVNILNFSAVAYFFAKEIYDKYKIPIGIINTSLGGSPAEAWMSEEALKEFPVHYQEAQKFKDDELIKQIEATDKKRIDEWYSLLRQKDEGYKNPQEIWSDPNLNTLDWQTAKVPGHLSDTNLKSVNGVIWFRKKINIPSSFVGKDSKLILGRIVDADSVFINGVFVGTTSYQYPPRRYEIPSGVLQKGENTIVVRVISNSGDAGFVLDKQYEIVCGSDTLDLKGEWQYKLGAVMEPLASQTFIRWKPLGLFNSMLSPLLNYNIKGVIWYQGESNAGRPEEYRTLLPALINDWRKNWELGDFPFVIAQLPNFTEAETQPSEHTWALMREAQLKTLSVSNTGLAVTIDIGEWNDVHPVNKKDVGKRLALAAQKIAYGNNEIVYSGPIYKSMEIQGNKIILSFTNTGSGLISKGGDILIYFSIAGDDKHFIWANAKIENDKIIVWNDNISNPVAVRYAWAGNPKGANLYNKEGLPASPFRTDDF